MSIYFGEFGIQPQWEQHLQIQYPDISFFATRTQMITDDRVSLNVIRAWIRMNMLEYVVSWGVSVFDERQFGDKLTKMTFRDR